MYNRAMQVNSIRLKDGERGGIASGKAAAECENLNLMEFVSVLHRIYALHTVMVGCAGFKARLQYNIHNTDNTIDYKGAGCNCNAVCVI